MVNTSDDLFAACVTQRNRKTGKMRTRISTHRSRIENLEQFDTDEARQTIQRLEEAIAGAEKTLDEMEKLTDQVIRDGIAANPDETSAVALLKKLV